MYRDVYCISQLLNHKKKNNRYSDQCSNVQTVVVIIHCTDTSQFDYIYTVDKWLTEHDNYFCFQSHALLFALQRYDV